MHHILACVSLSVPPSLHKYKLHSSSFPDGSHLTGQSLPSWRPWLSGHKLPHPASSSRRTPGIKAPVMMLEVELRPSIRVTGDVSLLRMVKDMFGNCGDG